MAIYVPQIKVADAELDVVRLKIKVEVCENVQKCNIHLGRRLCSMFPEQQSMQDATK